MPNNGGLVTWSKTPANNAGADTTVNWSEGQAPSSINDSARSLMASAAKWRDDISGAIVTGGTSAAYTVTSNQNFVNLTDFAGQVIAFSPHVTNAAGPVTMTVDGFANLPLRTSPGKELLAGTLVQGTPYVATYNHSDGALYLHGFYGNPYNVPLGVMLDFIGTTAPNSSFVLPFGQAISRTTYAALFAMVGTTYGAGDGTTTFNLPDLRGRVVAGKDDMGGSSANRLTNADDGLNGDTLGATGGGETQTLATANLPAYTPAGSVASTVNSAGAVKRLFGSITTGNVQYGGGGSGAEPAIADVTVSSSFTGTAQGGTSAAFGIVQPTIIVNKILRII